MRDLNHCEFIGRLGKDPEIKYLPSGKAVANFSIACSDDYKKDGQEVEVTNWINLVAFDKLAEIIGQYVKKGSQIYVSGKQKTRKWQDKEGSTRYVTEVVIDYMQMLGGNADSRQSTQQPVQQTRQETKPEESFPDEDIPF